MFTSIICTALLVGVSSARGFNVLQPRATANCPGEYNYTPSDSGSYNCNYTSSLKGAKSPYSTTTVSSMNDCVTACEKAVKCKVFGFQSSSNTCTLYSSAVANSTSTSGYAYYNRQCYTAVTYNTTPILNGGFETGDFTDWSEFGQGNVNLGVIAFGESSGYSASLQATGDTSSNQAIARIAQTFPVCQGVTYTFKASFYQPKGQTADGPGSLPQVNMYVQDNAGGPSYSLLAGASGFPGHVSNQNINYVFGKWHDLSLTFTPSLSNSWYVEAEVLGNPNTTMNLYFDNFIVQAK